MINEKRIEKTKKKGKEKGKTKGKGKEKGKEVSSRGRAPRRRGRGRRRRGALSKCYETSHLLFDTTQSNQYATREKRLTSMLHFFPTTFEGSGKKADAQKRKPFTLQFLIFCFIFF